MPPPVEVLVPLRLSNLPRLHPSLHLPTYPPPSPGILHIGAGNFHRAHQARYLHNLFQLSLASDWGILAASIYPTPLHHILPSQDCLYTLVEQSPTTTTATVIASIRAYLPPSPDDILRALADPSIRIVSLTITEGGYYLHPATNRFNASHPDILRDASRYTKDSPQTVFGILVAALRARRDASLPPFTVLSCDNIPHNGRVARDAVYGLARLCDPTLASWIDEHVAFPNSMVDRITPVTTDRERKVVADLYHVQDEAPVFCEGFTQWVVEDKFSAGRPPLEEVGVEFVDDVSPFEEMKIRILNGGHAVIAYIGGLMGYEFGHEAMADGVIRSFLLKVEKEEILPHVDAVPGKNLEEYLDEVVRRFANPKMEDTIRRLCFDGSNRQPKFIVPSIRRRLTEGGQVDGLALVSALWCRYCSGKGENGAVIEENDVRWAELKQVAERSREVPAAWVGQKAIYGDLVEDEDFVKVFGGWLDTVWSEGANSAVERYLNESGPASATLRESFQDS